MTEKLIVTDEIKATMLQMRKEGKTLAQVGEHFGIDGQTVSYHTRVPWKEWRVKKDKRVEEAVMSDDSLSDLEKMQKMRDGGKACDSIAEIFKVSRDYVYKNTVPASKPQAPLPEPKGDTLPEALKGTRKIQGRGQSSPDRWKIPEVTRAPKKEPEVEKVPKKKLKYPGKDAAGKNRLSLVPPGIIEAVGEVRTFGCKKYGAPDNWKTVEPELYVDALMRHLVRYLRDPKAVDEESGLSHLAHMACNLAFLIEMENTTCGIE